jgi:YQGE family putative transporter
MIASSGTIFYMMMLTEYSTLIFFVSGFIIGSAYGLHWANRNYLIMASTVNENRNYYTGTEFMLINIAFLFSPLLSGGFIGLGTSFGLYDKDTAYILIIGAIFLLCAIAAWLIISGTYKTPVLEGNFIHFKFGSIWKKMQIISFFKGALQGAQIILPSLLIMNLVGEEGVLGLITSLGAIVAALTVYIMGRIAKPEDRVTIMIVSIVIFFIGSLSHSLFYSAVTVLIWAAVQALHDPIWFEAYNPMWYRAMDVASEIEKKARYSFVINNEIYINAGRLLGICIFLVFNNYISEAFALRHFLLVVAILLFLVIPAAKKLPD